MNQEIIFFQKKRCNSSGVNLSTFVVICNIVCTIDVVSIEKCCFNRFKHIFCSSNNNLLWIIWNRCCFCYIVVTFINFIFIINSNGVSIWIVEWWIVNIFNVINKECFITNKMLCDWCSSWNKFVARNQVWCILKWIVFNSSCNFIIIETFIIFLGKTRNCHIWNIREACSACKNAQVIVCKGWIIPIAVFRNWVVISPINIPIFRV